MPDQIVPDSRVTEVLQDLATVSRDSQQGYRTAAEQTSDDSLKQMFLDLARRREQEADELDRLIRSHGGQPAPREGSATGRAHRLFVSLRAALTSNDRAAALREVARGESYAEAAFDRAKRQNLLGEAREVVQRLHDSVKQSRDKVRRMVEAEGGWSFPGGRRYLDNATSYVSGKPVTSSFVALGVGFVIGALTMLMARPAPGNGAARRHRYTPLRRGSYRSSAADEGPDVVAG
jgi:uncharacterized protein (TIGR02284 family)